MMIILNHLFILISFIFVNTHYIIYYSHVYQYSNTQFDCLYAYLPENGKETSKPYIRNYHLIPYCRRLDEQQNQINENIIKIISFKELKEQNITSEQLLQWFAPIDIAEKYQMNLNDSDLFSNCSLPWFGSQCQYKFDYDQSLSFGDIVETTFNDQKDIILRNYTGGTCYQFLSNCNRGSWPLCLDWREICDGKFDCLNGEDEEWCDQLEVNECNKDEYRCHYGGQCIPLSFLKDNRLSVDCLDGSDEQDILMPYRSLVNTFCLYVSTFRCQERIGRYPWTFQCGDGRYLIESIIPNYKFNCFNNRDKELSRLMVSSMDYIPNIDCQKSFYCALDFNRIFGSKLFEAVNISQSKVILNEDCEPLSNHCLSEWVVIPEQAIMFGFFQFVYFTNRSVEEFKQNITPDLICFNPSRCPMLLLKIISIQLINGSTCFHHSNLINNVQIKDFTELFLIFSYINRECLRSGIDQSCPNSSHFYCNQSMKCISWNRVNDGIGDCFYEEDELVDSCQFNDSKRYKCQLDSNKCLMPVAIGDGFKNCPLGDDELFIYAQNYTTLILFPDLCNLKVTFNFNSLDIIETDETNCQLWPCDNPYTHCDQSWHCLNGQDELNCPDTNCSFNEHQCYNQSTQLSHCLPFHYLYDDYLHSCNETNIFRKVYFYNQTNYINQKYLSWNHTKCITLDKLCQINQQEEEEQTCLYQSESSNQPFLPEVKFIQNNKYLCQFKIVSFIPPPIVYYFKPSRLGYLPKISINHSITTSFKPNQNKTIKYHTDEQFTFDCYRGIAALTGRNQTKICFCPPNYFGSRCQWQNQRISLTIQLRCRNTPSDTISFQLIIMIIDQHGVIQPYHEQLTYMPNRDCNTKYNIYLLYPDRPKSLSNNYSIRIELYEKVKLNYWTSWFIKIPFQFLPVNRISTQLIIPQLENNDPCSLSCGQHGKCLYYTNNESLFFCQCNEGYSGYQCQIKHECYCSNDSFCLTSSICICPLNKFGRYCYLKHSICQSSNNPCQHNGLCIPTDDRINLTGFTCFCPDDYSGERCENPNNRIDIHLDETIVSNNSLLLFHLITAFENAEHERISLLKKIPLNDQNITIYVTQPFNILLVQIPNEDYYLAILREVFIPSEHIYTKMSSSRRCLSLSELNETLFQSEYLTRVKYYPRLCRIYSKLMCFYDDELICICDIDRFSNCFLFNQTMNNDCQGYNYCENGGQCFQNNETCPTKLSCICEDCYYGSRCQFSTKGFLISLDSIVGYHIKPNIPVNDQPLIVKISIVISTIMFIIGLLNGLLSLMTFRRHKCRQVGSGNYLLISSISSMILIIILTIKFWILICSQMSLISDRSFLNLSCILTDVILRILLSSNEWLNSCVSIERMISVIKGTGFDQKKSLKICKWIIVSVFLIIVLTHIHDPIHRELIDDIDIDEKRVWCFVRYSSSIEIYNSFLTLFDVIFPFLINALSSVWIIKNVSYNRWMAQPEKSFGKHLQKQMKRHRHILIGPLILILLTLPRLMISFVSGCMRSSREPWLYLFGYYFSFIPSLLTIIIFIFPSETYKKELKTVIEQIIIRFRSFLKIFFK